jgi:hypothetical protein
LAKGIKASIAALMKKSIVGMSKDQLINNISVFNFPKRLKNIIAV